MWGITTGWTDGADGRQRKKIGMERKACESGAWTRDLQALSQRQDHYTAHTHTHTPLPLPPTHTPGSKRARAYIHADYDCGSPEDFSTHKFPKYKVLLNIFSLSFSEILAAWDLCLPLGKGRGGAVCSSNNFRKTQILNLHLKFRSCKPLTTTEKSCMNLLRNIKDYILYTDSYIYHKWRVYLHAYIR